MNVPLSLVSLAAAAPTALPSDSTLSSLLVSMLGATVGAVLMAAMQAGALIGAMFAVNKIWGDQLGDQHYGDVDLQNLDQRSLTKLIKQTMLIVGPPTLLWFLIFCVLYATYWVAWINWLPRVIVWPFHGAAIFGGLHLLYKLDWRKSAILAAATLLVYILLFWLLVPDNLFR